MIRSVSHFDGKAHLRLRQCQARSAILFWTLCSPNARITNTDVKTGVSRKECCRAGRPCDLMKTIVFNDSTGRGPKKG